MVEIGHVIYCNNGQNMTKSYICNMFPKDGNNLTIKNGQNMTKSHISEQDNVIFSKNGAKLSDIMFSANGRKMCICTTSTALEKN